MKKLTHKSEKVPEKDSSTKQIDFALKAYDKQLKKARLSKYINSELPQSRKDETTRSIERKK